MFSTSCTQKKGGEFILTDIPSKFNRKYTMLISDSEQVDAINLKNYNTDNFSGKLPRISNGKVVIPLWYIDYSTNKLSRYKGNHTEEAGILI